jgi:hypothetical protein
MYDCSQRKHYQEQPGTDFDGTWNQQQDARQHFAPGQRQSNPVMNSGVTGEMDLRAREREQGCLYE